MDAYVMPANDIDYSCMPYKSHKTYLTNHMGSLSHHIMPLVVHSLGGGHTHKHTCIRTFADRSNSKKPGVRPAHAWFKKQPTYKKHGGIK